MFLCHYSTVQFEAGGTLQVVVARHVSQPVHCSAPAITTLFSVAKCSKSCRLYISAVLGHGDAVYNRYVGDLDVCPQIFIV